MFCPKCGLNNDGDARFCFDCGERLELSSQPPPSSGQDWRGFNVPQVPQVPQPPMMPPVPQPIPMMPPQPQMPMPMQYQQPVLPAAAQQVIIGAPVQPSAFGGIFMFLSVIGLIGALGFAATRLIDIDIDTSTWPLIGKEAKKEARPGEGVLVSISGPCKDTTGLACNIVLDITAIKVTPANTEVAYEAKANGQANCQVAMLADRDVVAQNEAAGKPGPYLEGGRGRYYPLLSSTGFIATGGTLTCNKAEKGTWLFQPITGEPSVKLRYPTIPPARIDLSAPPVGKILPADDPISVIPVQSTGCTTAQSQPCQARWEMGPYGVGIDGSPTVFFSVRYDGPPNCTIPWQPLLGVHQREIAAQRKGIHLALVGNPPGDLTLTATGGMASSTTPHPCGQVLTGFLRFAPGNLTPTVNLMFWEFPPVQMPIKP